MSLCLGTFENGKVTEIMDLTQESYLQYKSYLKKITGFQQDQQLYKIVDLNYDDFFGMLNKYLSDYVQGVGINTTKMEMIMIDVNRGLLNYLSSFRTYLDHTETVLKKKYGKDSEQFNRFKTVCSNEYDTNFSYRFLYKLRNYSQHCGMPAGNLSINDRKDKESGHNISELIVQFDRDSLLGNYDSWGVPVKGEIEKLPSYFEVNEYVEGLQKSLEQIHLILIEIRIPEFTDGYNFIIEMINPLTKYSGIPCILNFKDMTSGGGKIRVEWFPLHLLESFSEVIK